MRDHESEDVAIVDQTADRKPLLIRTAIGVFFGGGMLLFINLFWPFLPEEIYYIVVFSVAIALLLLMVVSKLMAVVHAAKRDDAPRRWSRQ